MTKRPCATHKKPKLFWTRHLDGNFSIGDTRVFRCLPCRIKALRASK